MAGDIIKLTSFLDLHKVQNKGAAFGFLSWLKNSNAILIVLSLVTIIFFVAILIKNQKKINTLGKIAFGFILGGAVGNLIDRIQHGSVKDFINFHYKQFSWAPFNFADAFICIGVLLLLIALFTQHHEHDTSIFSEGQNANTTSEAV